jgi:mRNA export factor
MTTNFNFKCHRIEKKENGKSQTCAYPVNGVAFNNRHNTMATCGSEGTYEARLIPSVYFCNILTSYVFWDKDYRQKLKANPEPAGTYLGNSIIDIDFSPDSNFVAYAVAYDWAKGQEGKTDANEGLYVRRVADAEIVSKKKL